MFTKNATESLNLLAHSWGRQNLRSGDVVVLSELEHPANIVPWLMLAEERRWNCATCRSTATGGWNLSDLDRILDGAGLVSVSAMPNVLSTVPPIADIAQAAHRAGALVAVDGAQSVPHFEVDVAALGIDFLAFSAHNTQDQGIGVLWARAELLDAMPPFLGGGGMILDVPPIASCPPTPPNGSRPAPRPRRSGRALRRCRLPLVGGDATILAMSWP